MITTDHLYTSLKGLTGIFILQLQDSVIISHSIGGITLKDILNVIVAVCTVIALFPRKKKS